ncbi:MAG TPA: hypothetical protein VGX95_10190 [Xanthobacteraceae bacterium]|jgi:hypothetical protein|nr:hypothetical protein [Xanthobacteraceae bacterium]
MSPRMVPLATAGLAALAGVNLWLLSIILGDIILGDATGEEAPAFAAPAWDAKLSGPGRDGAAPKPISAYRQMLAQPVFFKTREPYVAPPPRPVAPSTPAAVAKPPPPAMVDPGLTVAGIIIGVGVRKAYIHGKSDPHGSWVSEGEAVTGWKVQAINPDGVKLQQQDRTIELQLYPITNEDHAPPTPPPRGVEGLPPPFMKQNPLAPVAGR